MSAMPTYTDVRLFHDRLRALATQAGELGMEAERAILEDVLFASERGTAQALADVVEMAALGEDSEDNTNLTNDPSFPPPGWAELPGHRDRDLLRRAEAQSSRPASLRYW